MFPEFQTTAVLIIGLTWLAIIHSLRRKRLANPDGLPYPPGPSPTPIVGNVLPSERPWLAYADWGKRYDSDILHARVFGNHFIVLNSHHDAVELLEKRGPIYSNRRYAPMLDISGFGRDITSMPYGDEWRLRRKIMHQGFSKTKVTVCEPTQTKKVRVMLRRLLEAPEEFRTLQHILAGEIILATVYGDDVSFTQADTVTRLERVNKQFGEITSPGKVYLVNYVPILRYVPSWFPGAHFKRMADECKASMHEIYDGSLARVRKQMMLGTAAPSFASRALEKHDENGGPEEEERAIKEVAGTAYSGVFKCDITPVISSYVEEHPAGAETTSTALVTFFHAVAAYPIVQQKAQEEIDRVIGRGRLPDYTDRPSLPYVEALCQEVLRWRPVVPLGVPRVATEDGIYNGYFIPKGSVILTNIWAMTHDSRTYTDPEEFRPERFFDVKGQLNGDDMSIIFGVGRRICPGRYLATSSIWLAIASILSAFNITKAHDSKGNEIQIPALYTDSLVSFPPPFRCSIAPRSAETRRLIESDT